MAYSGTMSTSLMKICFEWDPERHYIIRDLQNKYNMNKHLEVLDTHTSAADSHN
jgi:hypothetical protein